MTPEHDPDLNWQIMIVGDHAVKAGCDDPAVLYSVARARSSLEIGVTRTVVERLRKTAFASQYSPYVRLFAIFRLMDDAKDAAESRQLLKAIYETLPSVLAEKEFPPEHVAQFCSDLTAFGVTLDDDRLPMIKELHRILASALPDSAIPDLFLGLAYWRYSWDTPGVGVPQPLGTSRSDRHAVGQLVLETALQKDPHLAAASAAMIGTLLDSGIFGEETERYFQKAIADDPDCLVAYRYKIGTLNTGAPSAREDILNFGRTCLATKRW